MPIWFVKLGGAWEWANYTYEIHLKKKMPLFHAMSHFASLVLLCIFFAVFLASQAYFNRYNCTP